MPKGTESSLRRMKAEDGNYNEKEDQIVGRQTKIMAGPAFCTAVDQETKRGKKRMNCLNNMAKNVLTIDMHS